MQPRIREWSAEDVKNHTSQPAKTHSFTTQKERGLGPALFLAADYNLPPVTFDQDPLPMPVNPVVRSPASPFMGRTIIVSGNPNIVVALILVIARDPHKSALGRRTGILINGSRWPDANHNLGH